MEQKLLASNPMSSEVVFGNTSAPILNRVSGWHLIAIGLSGWVALYSSATINFQKSLAELAGHTQGICFAVAMILGGAEARKRKRERDHQQKLHDALKWADEMPDSGFEEQLSIHFHELEYRLEKINDTERAMGFCLRVVRDGRTTLVHSEFWRASKVDEEKLAKRAEGFDIKSFAADRVLSLTKADVSEVTRKRISLRSWNLISGTDFVNMTRDFPIFASARASLAQDATDNKQDIGPGGTERINKDSRTAKRDKGLTHLLGVPFHHYFMRGSLREKR